MKKCAGIFGIFMTLLLFDTVVTVTPPDRLNNTHYNCYRSYNIRVRPRGSRAISLDEERFYNDNIALARHHIIPFTAIRAFYNRILREDRNTFEYFFTHVVAVAGTNVGLNLHTDQFLNAMRNEPLADLPEVLRNHVTSADFRRPQRAAQELFTWLPFNIFIGPEPRDRADDPRDGFESNAYIIVGELRTNQLRQLHTRITNYLAGNGGARSIIQEMGDLLRTTPQPYEFNTDHWRVHITRHPDRFAIAIPDITADNNYRQLESDDYCLGPLAAFDRYDPPEFDRPRSPRSVHVKKGCLVQDTAAKYDSYCINSLNILQELTKQNVVTLNNNEIVFNDVAETTTTTTTTQAPATKNKSDCNPGVAAAGGAVTGGLSALAACLLLGGAYIPIVGWTGCAIGSAAYATGGVIVGTTASLASC